MSDETAVTTSAAALASADVTGLPAAVLIPVAPVGVTLDAGIEPGNALLKSEAVTIPIEQHEAAQALHQGILAKLEAKASFGWTAAMDALEADVKKLAELLHL